MEKVLRVEDGKYVSGEVIGAEVELMKLLWTNPSPTAAFAAQTITLDLSGYDSVFIVYRVNTSEELCCSGICVKGKRFRIGMNSGTNANTTYGTYGIWRDVIASQNGVTFQSSYYVYTGRQLTENNGYCIPIRIYGIKNKIQTIAKDVATTADKCIMSSGKSVEDEITELSNAYHNNKYGSRSVVISSTGSYNIPEDGFIIISSGGTVGYIEVYLYGPDNSLGGYWVQRTTGANTNTSSSYPVKKDMKIQVSANTCNGNVQYAPYA